MSGRCACVCVTDCVEEEEPAVFPAWATLAFPDDKKVLISRVQRDGIVSTFTLSIALSKIPRNENNDVFHLGRELLKCHVEFQLRRR